MKTETKLTIGILAKETGVGVETVRFYERKGLIKQPSKRGLSYRQYVPDDIKRIIFIKRAQELGFTLKEIQNLLNLNTNPRTTCSDVKERAISKVQEVKAKIKDLQRMKATLEEMVGSCGESKKAVSECRILDCFESSWKCEQ
jgi:MerR family mercuric resistance operon transcriptional regulator